MSISVKNINELHEIAIKSKKLYEEKLDYTYMEPSSLISIFRCRNKVIQLSNKEKINETIELLKYLITSNISDTVDLYRKLYISARNVCRNPNVNDETKEYINKKVNEFKKFIENW